MVATEIDNRVTRSSVRAPSTSQAGPGTSNEPLPYSLEEVTTPIVTTPFPDPQPETFVLPVDDERQVLMEFSERRFAPGTSLDDRLRFLVDLHLQFYSIKFILILLSTALSTFFNMATTFSNDTRVTRSSAPLLLGLLCPVPLTTLQKKLELLPLCLPQ
jgi:hypothetical protein